jgi:hypothetical protein
MFPKNYFLAGFIVQGEEKVLGMWLGEGWFTIAVPLHRLRWAWNAERSVRGNFC